MIMPPESQLIALLEFLGWTNIEQYTEPPEVHMDHEMFQPKPFWRGHAPGREIWQQIPPFTLDLMHEAEEKLPPNLRNDFMDRLDDVIELNPDALSEWHLVHATKEQRLEALLRTLNKWVESEVAK